MTTRDDKRDLAPLNKSTQEHKSRGSRLFKIARLLGVLSLYLSCVFTLHVT